MTQVREINIQTGEETARPYTQAELDAIAAYVPPPTPPTPPTPPEPSKAELLAQIAALAAKVEALP